MVVKFLQERTERLVTDVARWGSQTVKETVTAPLFHDKGSEIDEIIRYLEHLGTPKRRFIGQNANPRPLEADTATLTHFIECLENTLDRSQELFRSDLSRVEDRKPFMQLIESLKEEIEYLKAHPQEKEKELSPKTLESVAITLSKLRYLKTTTAGFLTQSARLASAAPELPQLVEHLSSLKAALLIHNPKKIQETFTLFSDLSTSALQRKDSIFPKLTTEDEAVFKEFNTIFHAYLALPDSLKQEDRIHPSGTELMTVVKSVASMLEKHINAQQTSVKSLLNSISSLPGQFAKNLLPTLQSAHNPSYTPFKKLTDAIAFFQGPGKTYPDERKKNLLLEYLQECDKASPGFANTILDQIAATHPISTQPPDHSWAREHLIDFDCAALKIVVENALQRLVQISQARGIPNPLDPPVSKPSGNTFLNYANTALSYLEKRSFLPEAVLQTIGSSFSSLLTSDFLAEWIKEQNQETQDAFNAIKETTCAALRVAKHSKLLEDYKAAFKTFTTLWNKHHILLDTIELPTLFEDSHIKKTQAEVAKKLDATMLTLRKEMTLANIQDSDFDWTDEATSSAKINDQLKELSNNFQDHLTYQFVEKLIGKKENDTTFYNIKKLQKLQTTKEKKAHVFITELKKAIDNSNASWPTRALAKLLVFRIHGIIGHYISSIITKSYQHLHNELKKIDKQDLLLRSTNCFSKYSALLTKWASLKDEGGEKNAVINEHMNTKAYLKYGSKSYSEAELYAAVADTFINNYFHLYKADVRDTSIRAVLGNALPKMNQFVLKRPLYPKGFFSSTFNYLTIIAKALFIGIPSHLTIRALQVFIFPFEIFSNWITKKIFSFSLQHFKAIGSVIQSTRNGLYENNPYVQAITGFIADQLEALSKTLEEERIAGAPATKDTSESIASAVSEKTREMIRTAAAQLFEILNKNKFPTQTQLSNYLDSRGLSFTQDKLDHIVLPIIIENIIDVIVIAADKLLTPQALQKPTSLLLDQLNEILVEAPTTDDPEKLKIEKLKNQTAEDKMYKYADLLIHQIITRAVDGVFDSRAQKYVRLAQDTKTWIQTQTALLLEKWQIPLDQIKSEKTSPKASYEALQKMYEHVNAFLLGLESRGALLKEHSSRTSTEVTLQLSDIILSLNKVLKGDDNHTGFLSLYENHKILYKTKEDLPHLTACDRAYHTIKSELPNLLTRFDDTTLSNKIFANSSYIKQTLRKLYNQELSLFRDASQYIRLNSLVDSSKKQVRAEEEKLIQEKFLPSLRAAKTLHTELTSFITKKKIDLRKYKRRGLFRFFTPHTATFTTSYKNLLAEIKKIPSIKTQKTLEALLRQLYDTTNGSTIDTLGKELKQALETILSVEQDKLSTSVARIIQIDKDLHSEIHSLCERFKADVETRERENSSLILQLETTTENLTTTSEALKDLTFVHSNVGVVDSLKTLPIKASYHYALPKVKEGLKLIKDGTIAEFLFKHLFLMRFVDR